MNPIQLAAGQPVPAANSTNPGTTLSLLGHTWLRREELPNEWAMGFCGADRSEWWTNPSPTTFLWLCPANCGEMEAEADTISEFQDTPDGMGFELVRQWEVLSS